MLKRLEVKKELIKKYGVLNTMNEKDGVLYVKLDSYLRELRAVEQCKPKNERRYVPTMSDLAKDIGISTKWMSDLVRGRAKSLTFELGSSILTQMHHRGFAMEPNDLLGFLPPKDSEKD